MLHLHSVLLSCPFAHWSAAEDQTSSSKLTLNRCNLSIINQVSPTEIWKPLLQGSPGQDGHRKLQTEQKTMLKTDYDTKMQLKVGGKIRLIPLYSFCRLFQVVAGAEHMKAVFLCP